MTTHAVAERTSSGPATLLGRAAGPSEPDNRRLPEPTTPEFRREGGAAVEDDLTPPRTISDRPRSTDLMKATIPLPQLAWLIGAAIAIAAAMWRTESQLDLLNERIAHEREMDNLREKGLEDRFKMLEAKIEAAGLRNSAMLLSQELVKKGR